MKLEQHGPEDGKNLVWILGWGNKLHHTNVNWLIEQLVDAGYRVHCFEIPTEITDFEREYIAPVADHLETLDSFRLLSHSAGGLIAAYLEGAETTTFLSPFWGFREGQMGLDTPLIRIGGLLPVSKPLFPAGVSTRESKGQLATDRELAEGPTRAAPTWLRECRRAHRDRPPIPEDAVVFATLSDRVVSVNAIGDGVPETRIVTYDGGHELFSSPSRETHLETLLSVIESGASALE